MTKEVAGLSPRSMHCSSAMERDDLQAVAGSRDASVHVTTAVWENSVEAQRNLADWRRRFEEHKTLIRPVHDEADLDRAIADDVTGVIFGFQGSSPIENDVSLVETFHRLGVRVMQLTYNNQSFIGGGCYETFDAGITRFGHEVIREMNRLGMIIDLSHCGEKTTNDAIEISERSVAITHANPASVHGVDSQQDRRNAQVVGRARRNPRTQPVPVSSAERIGHHPGPVCAGRRVRRGHRRRGPCRDR